MSEEDLVLDFTDVKASSFDVLKPGWYLCEITDASDSNPTKGGPNAKLPAGTTGTNWEFTVTQEVGENRKLWTNHWHHPSTLGFMKTLLLACGAYTEETFPEALNINDARDAAEGMAVYVRVAIRKSEQYGEQNDVKGFKSTDNPPKTVGEEGSSGGAASLLP